MMDAFPHASKIVTNFTDAFGKESKKIKGIAKGLWGSIDGIGETISANWIMVLTAFVTIMNKVAEAEEKAYEKAKQQADKTKEIADKRAEEANQLQSLIKQYEEAAKSSDGSAESRQEILNIQKQINALVGGENDNLDLVNGNLEEQLSILRAISAEKAAQDESDYIAAYSAAAEASDKSVHKVGVENWIQKINSIGGNLVSDKTDSDSLASEIFANSNIGVIGSNSDAWSSYWEIVGENAKERYENAQKAIKALETDVRYNHTDSDLYNKLVEARDLYYQDYQNEVAAVQNLVNSSLSAVTLPSNLDTREDYESFRLSLVNRLESDSGLATARERFLLGSNNIPSYVDDYLSATLPDIFNKFLEDAEADTSSNKTVQKVKEVSDRLKEMFDSEAFDDMRESLTELANAGELTADKVVELSEGSLELSGMLSENGMSARFLANVLNKELSGQDGFSLVTDDALRLNSALTGLTSRFDEIAEAKSEFDAAMAKGEKDDDFKSYAEAFSALNDEFVSGTTNSNTFWAAAEYMFGTEQLEAWGWSVDEVYNAMQNCVGIFGDAESAGKGFLDKLDEIAEEGQVLGEDGSVLATIEKLTDGGWNFDVDGLHLDELAGQMGMSSEATLACLEALSMFGDVRYYDIQEVLDAIKEIGLSSDDFDTTAVNVDALTEQLSNLGYNGKEIHDIFESIKNDSPEMVLFDTSKSIETVTDDLIKLGVAAQNGVNVSINTQSFGEFMSQLGYTKDDTTELLKQLGNTDNIKLTNAQGEVLSLDDALLMLENIDFKQSVVEGFEETIDVVDNATDKVKEFQKEIDGLHGKTVTVDIKIPQQMSTGNHGGGRSRFSYYNSTDFHRWNDGIVAHARGTDNAKPGKALVGEEGEELVQSKDRAYFVGTNNPEIVDLSRGDIVYNAEETKKIKNGRGHLHGTIPSFKLGGAVGSSKFYTTYIDDGAKSVSAEKTATTTTLKPTRTSSTQSDVKVEATEVTVEGENVSGIVAGVSGTIPIANGGASGGMTFQTYDSVFSEDGENSSSGSSSEEKEPKVFDWVEIAIDRISSAVDKLKTIATSTYNTLKTRLSATYKEITKVNEQIAVQQKAYDKYISKANSVGLSSDLVSKVQNGSIEIGDYDEDIAEQITEYQEWYAISCYFTQ